MPAGSAVPTSALSDDEFEALADFLDAHATFDIDGLLGFLNAIAVAPSLLPPSAWLPAVLPEDRLAGIGHDQFKQGFDLLLRQYNDVLDALAENSLIAPDAEDEDTCTSFAAGFAAGAALDSEWIGNDDHWTFASPLAYLGGRLDLVPPHELEKLDADPGAKALIRKQMSAIVGTTADTFKKYRQVALPLPVRRAARVGRNDPCSCGSGRKFKRCCAGNPQPGSQG